MSRLRALRERVQHADDPLGDAAGDGLSEGAVAEGGGVVGVAGEEQFDEDGGHGGAAGGAVALAGEEADGFRVVAAFFERFA